MIYTVFPKDKDDLPQDFETEEGAKEYGNSLECEYEIESTEGEVV